MLKPKRKITKQELKKDPFLEFLNNTQQWFNEKKKLIYQVAFGVIAVLAIVFFVNNSKSKSSGASEALLGKALLSQDMGDAENAKFQLQSLVDDFDGTKAGIEGKFYLGKTLFDEGEIESAANNLNEFVNKSENDLLKVTAYKILAEIATKKDNADEAEKLLEKGVRVAENSVYQDEMRLLYANQLITNGNTEKAKKIVDEILEQNNLLFSIKRTAEELQGRI